MSIVQRMFNQIINLMFISNIETSDQILEILKFAMILIKPIIPLVTIIRLAQLLFSSNIISKGVNTQIYQRF